MSGGYWVNLMATAPQFETLIIDGRKRRFGVTHTPVILNKQLLSELSHEFLGEYLSRHGCAASHVWCDREALERDEPDRCTTRMLSYHGPFDSMPLGVAVEDGYVCFDVVVEVSRPRER